MIPRHGDGAAAPAVLACHHLSTTVLHWPEPLPLKHPRVRGKWPHPLCWPAVIFRRRTASDQPSALETSPGMGTGWLHPLCLFRLVLVEERDDRTARRIAWSDDMVADAARRGRARIDALPDQLLCPAGKSALRLAQDHRRH